MRYLVIIFGLACKKRRNWLAISAFHHLASLRLSVDNKSLIYYPERIYLFTDLFTNLTFYEAE